MILRPSYKTIQTEIKHTILLKDANHITFTVNLSKTRFSRTSQLVGYVRYLAPREEYPTNLIQYPDHS